MAVSPFEPVDSVSELQKQNGNAGQFQEIGTSGMQVFAGYISQAYNAELRWPSVYALFDRIRRSDPEITMVRQVFNSLGRQISFEWELPDNPSTDDKKFQEFGYTVLDDLEGGFERFRDAMLSYVPFFGWGWWEIVAGLRNEKWRPPQGDEWESKYNDGLIGVRRLAWRDPSSFESWEIDDERGRLTGMNQLDLPNPPVLLPLQRAVHLTMGDTESPEGLSPLEAVWRLERIKYGLELVQGIGFDHSAGYLDVTTEKATLTADDHASIRKAARAVQTVQEGNYVAWPKNISGELKDVPFSAASTLLESIRYYGILKLQVYAMSWIAMATTANTGAYSAVQDVSGLFIKIFNSMNEGFVQQLDRQFGKRLYEWNKDKFPGITERPKLIPTPIEKQVLLGELSTFMSAFASLFPMDDEDIIAIRRHSGILSDTLPEEDDIYAPDEDEEDDEDKDQDQEDEEDTDVEDTEGDEEPTGKDEDKAEDKIKDKSKKEMALRPFKVSKNEQPTDVTYLAPVTKKDIEDAIKWARKYDPALADFLEAEPLPEKKK